MSNGLLLNRSGACRSDGNGPPPVVISPKIGNTALRRVAFTTHLQYLQINSPGKGIFGVSGPVPAIMPSCQK